MKPVKGLQDFPEAGIGARAGYPLVAWFKERGGLSFQIPGPNRL
jgi:hypothetical protein